MQNFTFYNPTKVLFGKGSIASLQDVLPVNEKVMLLYGGGSIKKNGVYDQVKEQLAEFDVTEFSGIEPNPEYETLLKAIDLAKAENITYLLAVGGGSVVDGTKFVAAALHYDGEPMDILRKGSLIKSAMPLGCILTLPATGSETNGNAVVNNSATHEKRAFGSDFVRPQFAILDPEVTYTLPKRQLINGVVDAFVHVVEQYITYPVNATVQDRFAEGILQNLIELGPDMIDKQDYELRANLMWNATQALSGLIGAGVPQDWSTHTIGHQLTALYGLDHAVTLAIVLPSLLRYQKEKKHAKLLQYAQRVWHLDTTNEDAAIEQAIQNTEEFFRKVGMKTKLSEHGIEEDVYQKVADLLKTSRLVKFGEHLDVTPEKSKDILAAAY